MSKPLIFGIITSLITISGGSARTDSNARTPSVTVSTW